MNSSFIRHLALGLVVMMGVVDAVYNGDTPVWLWSDVSLVAMVMAIVYVGDCVAGLELDEEDTCDL